MRPVIFLFDIDGTLLSTGGAGRRAMMGAFRARHGREDACSSFSFAGMTDRGIARAGLRAIGQPDDERAIDALLAAYLELLTAELSPSECVVHPGVHDAVAIASRSPRAAMGLGTGNVRRGAELKLEAAGLGGRFSFGGFGCDHESRAELLRTGATRGAERLGQRLDRCRVIVIGDTPRDIEAAHAIGADCLAVATGGPSLGDLAACRPALACPDLACAEAVAFLRDAAL